MTGTDEQAFLTEAELLARYRGALARGTLRNWRSRGLGPPGLRIGRQVLYRLDDVIAWERTLERPPVRRDG